MKLFLASLLLAVIGLSQTADFDDLAHRAEAALDRDPAQAAALYKQALDQRPAWPAGWFYLGGALYRLQRYTEAVDTLHKGLDLAPNSGAAWGLLGLSEYELGHLDLALTAIGKGEQFGLGANKGFEAAVRQRAATILIHRSLFDQAMAQLQPLAKNQENSPAVVEAVGLCALAVATDPAKLPESRRKVVDMAGKAMWAATSQRPKDAEEGFAALLAAYPKEPGVHYAFGLYLLDTDQPRSAGGVSQRAERESHALAGAAGDGISRDARGQARRGHSDWRSVPASWRRRAMRGCAMRRRAARCWPRMSRKKPCRYSKSP